MKPDEKFLEDYLLTKNEDNHIKNTPPEIYDKKGILILEYEYEEKTEKYEYNGNDDDEV